MNIEVIKDEKDEIEFKIDNQTIAEILRVYLNNLGVEFAAWRKEHPTKPVIMKVKTSGKTTRKAISEAIAAINKDADEFSELIKKK